MLRVVPSNASPRHGSRGVWHGLVWMVLVWTWKDIVCGDRIRDRPADETVDPVMTWVVSDSRRLKPLSALLRIVDVSDLVDREC